jgi:hypothetical protein
LTLYKRLAEIGWKLLKFSFYGFFLLKRSKRKQRWRTNLRHGRTWGPLLYWFLYTMIYSGWGFFLAIYAVDCLNTWWYDVCSSYVVWVYVGTNTCFSRVWIFCIGKAKLKIPFWKLFVSIWGTLSIWKDDVTNLRKRSKRKQRWRTNLRHGRTWGLLPYVIISNNSRMKKAINVRKKYIYWWKTSENLFAQQCWHSNAST